MASPITSDGQTETIAWPGGEGTFLTQDTAAGTYGTFTLQYSMDGGTTWTAVSTDTTLTASGGGNFQLPNVLLRGDLSGSSGASIQYVITRSDVRT